MDSFSAFAVVVVESGLFSVMGGCGVNVSVTAS